MRRVLAATLVVGLFSVVAPFAGVPAGASSSTRAQASAPILGGGASFPQPIYAQWTADVARAPYNLSVNYQAAGSTFGRTKYLSGELDFGGSDIPFSQIERSQVASSPRKNFAYVPMTAGGLGLMFNVIGTNGQRIRDLNLRPKEVCRLFTEDTIYWDDPEIVAVNAGVPLPHNRVRPVVRSDGSGTSYVLSEYCIATSPAVWSAFVSLILTSFPDAASPEFQQGQPTSQWPTGWGAVSTGYASDGVANVVANDSSGRDTVTYNEAEFARVRGFTNASIQNAAGVFKQPDPPAVTAALAYATGRADGTFALRYDVPDAAAYFPSSYSYMVVPTDNFPANKGFTLASFLNYCVTAGQRQSERLSFARLSDVLVNLALDQIQRIPGAPPRPTDLAGASSSGRPTLGAAAALSPSAGGSGSAAAGTPKAGASAAAPKAGSGSASAAAGGATVDPTTGATIPAAGGSTAADSAAGGSAAGGYKIDVSKLPTAVATIGAAGGSGDPISDKDALWYFVLGFAVLGIGLGLGSSSGAFVQGRRKLGADS